MLALASAEHVFKFRVGHWSDEFAAVKVEELDRSGSNHSRPKETAFQAAPRLDQQDRPIGNWIGKRNTDSSRRNVVENAGPCVGPVGLFRPGGALQATARSLCPAPIGQP